MPVLTIKDARTSAPIDFFYQDSGAPDRQVYTTLVVAHGICFHSAVFQHVLPLATSKGMRMVCLNRRDYPGSTPYSPCELKALSEGVEDELLARGEELALFLDGLIDTLSLPGPTADGNEGGLGLMGWSLGNVFTLSAMASMSSVQPQVQSRLQSYMRSLILFDPPMVALGIPAAESYPLSDMTLSAEERLLEFVPWVSSYFAHGDLSTRNVDNLEYKVPNPDKKSVSASLSPEERNSLVDTNAAARSDFVFLAFNTQLSNQVRKVLFDPETRSQWPNLDIWLLYCDSSPGLIIYAAWELEKLAKESDQPMRISTITDAHHLVFWDEPQRAIDAFDYCLRRQTAT
ncbi:hypothetical protein JB92DRAFT_3145111 [Gautieria morchelliformis]|nr:hypothetical protein JB92DRAFT_3145111 [Gautieria morchelliformis]